jgi:hypothetical protein
MPELHVITTISNPLRYDSRFRLYEEFRKRFASEGVRFYTVELAFEENGFVVTDSGNERHFQVRSRDVIWHKENLINIALKWLPSDWKYAAWVDADISFVRPDWIDQTLEQLKHNTFVQMFSHVIDLGPAFEPLRTYEGFAYRHLQSSVPGANQTGHGVEYPTPKKKIGQTGYAWAARRDALEAVGGLIDWSILGANDYYMALALVGEVDPQGTRMPESNYARMFMEWQNRCVGHGCTIGYLNNSLLHYWHGNRRDRGYDTRWQILANHAFDPATDLHRNIQGVLEVADTKPGLREAIRTYFMTRNEDSNEA